MRRSFKATVPSTLHRWGGDAVNSGAEVDLADNRETHLADYQVHSALQTNPYVCLRTTPTRKTSPPNLRPISSDLADPASGVPSAGGHREGGPGFLCGVHHPRQAGGGGPGLDRAALRGEGRSHMQTLIIYKLDVNQNHNTFTLISLKNTVICSKFP